VVGVPAPTTTRNTLTFVNEGRVVMHQVGEVSPNTKTLIDAAFWWGKPIQPTLESDLPMPFFLSPNR
jgi:hypothetical protein